MPAPLIAVDLVLLDLVSQCGRTLTPAFCPYQVHQTCIEPTHQLGRAAGHALGQREDNSFAIPPKYRRQKFGLEQSDRKSHTHSKSSIAQALGVSAADLVRETELKYLRQGKDTK